MTWTTLTRRTEPPKLKWLMHALTEAGVANRLNGSSFHAPILEVADVEQGQRVLGPVDNLPDDDLAFRGRSLAWWMSHLHDPLVGDLVAGVGVAANAVRSSIADEVKCVPQGLDTDECPLASGILSMCPAKLWTICRPMVRLETFCLSMAEVLPVTHASRVSEVAELVTAAIQQEHGQDALLAGFIVLSNWLTQDLLADLATHAPDLGSLGMAINAEVVKTDEGVVPLRSEITYDEAVNHGFSPENN